MDEHKASLIATAAKKAAELHTRATPAGNSSAADGAAAIARANQANLAAQAARLPAAEDDDGLDDF